MSKLDWYFIDYPNNEDLVLAKTTEDKLVLASWNSERWLTSEGNPLDAEIACWAYIYGVPSSKIAMPPYRGGRWNG